MSGSKSWNFFKKQNQEADENQQQAEALETRYAEYQRITADFENSKSEWAAKEKELQSLESFRPLVEQREQLTTQKRSSLNNRPSSKPNWRWSMRK